MFMFVTEIDFLEDESSLRRREYCRKEFFWVECFEYRKPLRDRVYDLLFDLSTRLGIRPAQGQR